MSTVQEIERAIETLSPEQMEELQVWLDERYAQQVDLQLHDDVKAGRFDDLIDEAVADFEAGRTLPLP